MPQQAFYFDGTRCSGCKTCAFACMDYHDLAVGQSYRKVYECVGGSTDKNEQGCFVSTCFSYNLTVSCNHCLSPICVEVCPTEAMHKNAETGLVAVNQQHCIGCGYCHLSCPYDAPSVDRQKGHSVKCDGCESRVSAGEKPVCVEACPSRALDFAPADTFAQQAERGNIAPLPDPTHTLPNLFVKASADAPLWGTAGVTVANLAEVHPPRRQ